MALECLRCDPILCFRPGGRLTGHRVGLICESRSPFHFNKCMIHKRLFLMVLLVQMGMLTSIRADEMPTPDPQTLPEMEQDARDWLDAPGSGAFGKWLTKVLEQHPDAPEWLEMFADILQGSELGPADGWFRKAVAQTRYDWRYLS